MLRSAKPLSARHWRPCIPTKSVDPSLPGALLHLLSAADCRVVGPGSCTRAWRREMNDAIAQLLAEGQIRPHVDRVLTLDDVKEAMRAVADRSVRGRIVLKMR
ncbi:MAG: zinc-binding dehydrogenase [Rhodospirillales bacterium]|nr:zinc-binding dehydrogenase [Rhodospirillales bacterium]